MSKSCLEEMGEGAPNGNWWLAPLGTVVCHVQGAAAVEDVLLRRPGRIPGAAPGCYRPHSHHLGV